MPENSSRSVLLNQQLLHRILWSAVVLLVVLLGVGYFVSIFLLNAWLRSDAFRVFLNQKTSSHFHVEGQYQPIQWTGFSFYSDGYVAQGIAGSPFSELRTEQIRAEFYPQGIFHRSWQINDLQIQRLKIGFASLTSGTIASPFPTEVADTNSSSWIPHRLDIRHAQIQQADLNWSYAGGTGGLQEMRVTLEPEESALRANAVGGRLFQSGFPTLKVDHLKIRYQKPDLFLTDSLFKLGDSGEINLSGQARLDQGGTVDLQTSFNGVSITQFLPEDWRAQLHGTAGGEATLKGNDPESIQIVGKLKLNNGQIEALPILDTIAAFTNTVQFRRLTLHTVTADFNWSQSKCSFSHLIIESQGLIRVEGDFVVEQGNLNGTLMVGVTPSSLRWLPGSQERVFTQERAGFVWTPVRVSGPLTHLQEDLSARLLTAAKEQILHDVHDVKGTLEKGVQGVFDLFSR